MFLLDVSSSCLVAFREAPQVGFSLLWSFIKFCFVHVDQIWWKTILATHLLAEILTTFDRN